MNGSILSLSAEPSHWPCMDGRMEGMMNGWIMDGKKEIRLMHLNRLVRL